MDKKYEIIISYSALGQKNIDIGNTKDYTLFITRRYTNAKY
jgi:hypothetical protein